MFSRLVFIANLSLALLACTLVLGTANVQAQTISTVAGNGAGTGTSTGSFSGDGGFATSAGLNQPKGLAFDASGNMYIADQSNHRIRRVTPSGLISTFAGTGIAGYSGDGGPATAAMLNQPGAVAFDAAGNLIIADSQNRRIRKVSSSTGIITTIAGTGTEGYSGDGGPATSAMLHRAVDLAVDTAGNLYFADSVDNRVRKISTSGIITTVAGTGIAGYSGEGVPATSATLNVPLGVAVDSTGNLYIADARNHVVRRVRPSDGFIFTVAGNGKGAGTDTGSFSGDSGLANQAGLNTPEGVAVDPAGNFYIADTENYRIRKVTASNNVITTIAGTGTNGFSGDGGLAIQATMNLPWSVELDATGNLFIGDMQNQRIRKITLSSGTTGGPPTVGGVLNNASYNLASLSAAPGSIAAIFGSNLTDGTSCLPPACNPTFGGNGRLNTTMSGAQATVNGTPVPIFYSVSGQVGQLGVEIPSELTSTSATVQVTVGGHTSAPVTVSVSPTSPGIFTFSSDGKGAGAITHADLLGTPITPQAPASPGEMVIIYATGLGQVTPFVATGAMATGASATVAQVTVTIDGIAVIPDFAGLAGCCIGLNQINVRIPANARSGAAIPVSLSISGKPSNPVTIAVQ